MFLGWNISDGMETFFSIFARMAIMAASSATWVATSEIYPTRMRATGHALSSAVSKMGAFVSPFVAEGHLIPRQIVAILLSVACVAAAFASFLLPVLKNY